MASKNLRKIINWGLSIDGFDRSKFDPRKYHKNWAKFEKYVDKKEKTMIFNSMFRPLYKQLLNKELGAYINGGHKVSSALKREIKSDVKARAKEIVQAKIKAAANPPQQSYKEQETILPEG